MASFNSIVCDCQPSGQFFDVTNTAVVSLGANESVDTDPEAEIFDSSNNSLGSQTMNLDSSSGNTRTYSTLLSGVDHPDHTKVKAPIRTEISGQEDC